MIFKFGKLLTDTEKEPYRSEGLRIAFYSAPGTRKSYTVAACIIEPFLAQGGTVVIFEPKSEWHTLKQKYSSIIVVGGPFQDIPLATNHAKVYADAIVQNGVSMVFDFTETEDKELVRFAAELLARIFTLENVARRSIVLFFEELSEYCPLSVKGKLVEPWIYERMSSRIVKIATQGRALGINIVSTSQRPAQLNFTVRMMMNLSLYGKFHPKDLTDIKEVLSHYALSVSPKEMATKCVDMPHGSWIAITSEGVTETKIETKRVTPHGADTPKVEYVAPMTDEAQRTMQELTKTITDALEQERAEESSVEKLKRQMGELQKELGEKLKKIDQLETALTVKGSLQLDTNKAGDSETISRLSQELEQARREKAEIRDKLKEKVLKVFEEPSEKSFVEKPEVMTDSMAKIWFEKLPTKASKSVFEFLLKHRGIKFTKPQIALQTGYKNTAGGTFGTAFKILKDNNLVKTDGKMFWCE